MTKDELATKLVAQLQTALQCAEAMAEAFGPVCAQTHYDHANALAKALQNIGVDGRLLAPGSSTFH